MARKLPDRMQFRLGMHKKVWVAYCSKEPPKWIPPHARHDAGCCVGSLRKIWTRRLGAYSLQRKTLAHELYHAAMFEYGLWQKYSEIEEPWIQDWEIALDQIWSHKRFRLLFDSEQS